MADRKISDLTALTTPAAGDYLPIVDISEAAAASKNKRITVEELMRGAPDGTAGAPGFAFESDPNTGIYSPGADQVAISTNGTGRLFVDANGRVGVGTSSPGSLVELSGSGSACELRLRSTDTTNAIIRSYVNSLEAGKIAFTSGRELFIETAGAERLRITSAGLVGIGDSNPGALLSLKDGNVDNVSGSKLRMNLGPNPYWELQANNGGTAATRKLEFYTNSGSGSVLTLLQSGSVGIGTTSPARTLDVNGSIQLPSNNALYISGSSNYLYADSSATELGSATKIVFTANGSQRAVIDSSGRLLVGASTSRTVAIQYGIPGSILVGADPFPLQIESGGASGASFICNRSVDGYGPALVLGRSRGANPGGIALVASNDNLGSISFNGADGTDLECIAAAIRCDVDGTPGANDMPGRLVFSTTADGASSPTERMRIGSSGTARLFTSDYGLLLGNSQSAGTTYTALEIYAGSTSTTSLGTLTLQIYNNGNVQNTNNSYGALSDIKLKENIVDATSQWGDIKALQVRKYNFKEGQTHTQIGLIAQEVELVSPGLVTESPDRDAEGNDLGTVTKSVNYSVLYMKAVKALQEAMERIEQLEASNADLLARVVALESA